MEKEIEFIKEMIKEEYSKDVIKNDFFQKFGERSFTFRQAWEKALHTYTDKPVPEVEEENKMIINHPTKRFKVEFIVDTHLSREKLVDYIEFIGGFSMSFEEEK